MNYLESFREIKTFLFDVDGVMTNCAVLITEDGALLRTMTVRDGYAVKIAVQKGYRVAIITAGRSTGVAERLKALGIEDVILGAEDKVAAYRELKKKYDLIDDHTLYMGDDLPDRDVMLKVGLRTCPADAVPEIRELAQYVSPYKGGEGCVRDVIEKVLRLNGQWPYQTD